MLRKFSIVIGGAMLAQQAVAHHITANFDIGNMASQADLVFRGKVIEIDYRGSQSYNGNSPIPHTFVTFSVDDVLFGNPGDAKRRTFTLRFMGGPNDKGDIMLVQQLPQFNIGDEDILFVTMNGSEECPLVDCVNGRFRVVDSRIYNEYGQQLLRNEKGQLVLGRAEAREEFTAFTIGGQKFTRRSHRDSSLDVDEGADTRQPFTYASSEHLDSDVFISIARDRISRASSNDPAGKTRVAKTADKNRPFTLPAPKPVTIAEPETDIPAEEPATEQEKAELDAMRRNGGDPVIQ
ncbi:MAG: hypothetical protein L0Z73_02770 [Gammaproteobacteria bacterium]|nr:hypothetical protein [Gammaproteobacteria bacterium]